MKNTFGNNLTVTLFGESHGTAIGAVMDGVPSGVRIDMDIISRMVNQRKAAGTISTGRKEDDIPEFVSGVKNGVTEGTPITFFIQNKNVHSSDYNALENVARPSHADYAGHMKYRGNEDASGGGHFSGRLTAPLVVCGAICMCMLKEKHISIGTHISRMMDIVDRPFDEDNLLHDIEICNEKTFSTLDDEKGQAMIALINDARNKQDSVGGILDTAIVGMDAGVGEPAFDSVESMLSHALFSIPACKGVMFGSGFDFASMYGSKANDAFEMKDGKVTTVTNHNGGINSGITNGMPIRFQTVFKPTPSISQKQKTVNFKTNENVEIEIHGRHDPAIIHRARVVVDAMCAITLVDLLITRYGTMYFGEER